MAEIQNMSETAGFLDGLALGGMLPLAWALNIEFVPGRMRSTVVTVIMVGFSLGSAIAGPRIGSRSAAQRRCSQVTVRGSHFIYTEGRQF